MPELPEVETIARGLRPMLTGRSVMNIPHMAAHLAPVGPPAGQTMLHTLVGREIHGVSRRGKLLFLELAQDDVLAFHLRMTGRLGIAPCGTPPDPHVHLLLDLDNGSSLYFQDQRKFGMCTLFSPDQLAAWPFFRDLGPEPLELSPEQFARQIRGKTGRIKALLLDQRIIAGIGNIYADESLFRAGIHPATPANQLTPMQQSQLLAAIQSVLQEAIAAGGSSIRDYRTAAGLVGTFQDTFEVYGRKGLPCKHCNSPLQTTKVAGRTTSFCPSCQAM
ncbi:bifunctional DNA-formamidopyrimidine glycosylase/DNA-(apurinic or apyrimidinic site) lyase [Desulfonatronum thioautotrophicum]|uniref:bifunctional DNA-formamidopyrimidine glycosylase/DNA-(apurinic or apyrimidinic site) lyase n=1 Tax=Desulfonatronum thioautotrophicum TaxID=617001 RepID=UPI0005EB0EC3|nr:bifunctional DNA-formamidopyrimidine glycosylase/DNA-(apurinic or apyrimidinic site) lyase [Desulfonatronum thioautotrophicum]